MYKIGILSCRAVVFHCVGYTHFGCERDVYVSGHYDTAKGSEAPAQ